MSAQANGPCYLDRVKLETPAEGTEVMVNCWWWEKDGQILDYRMGNRYYAQANKMREVMQQLIDVGTKLYLDHKPVLIPVAYYRSTR